MHIRKANLTDIEALIPIFEHARSIMRSNGNFAQWQNGYPTKSAIESDINQGCTYICEDENKDILATFFFRIGNDPTYNRIDNGNWLNNDVYAVVHRLATSGKVKGMGEYCLNWCFEQWPNIRIDTHESNKIMQLILQKNGYIKCGIIYIADGSERIAYQKIK